MSRRLRELESLPAARWFVTLAWTALLFILLVQPDDQRLIETGIPRGPNTLPRELFFTAAHVLAFALTCIVWFRAIGCHLSPKRSLALALGMAIGIGALTEGLQAFSPERYPSLGDLAANCAGALLAARMIWRRTMVSSGGWGGCAMKKILTLTGLLLILCGGQIMLAQTANADIYAVARGDLWKYDGADGGGRRLTRSGYNGGPVLSPDGRRFAFMQTAAGFIARFREGSAAQAGGTAPADIWTYDIASSAYRQIADQTGASSAGFIRSLPTWSPDSQKLAWLQVDPAAQPLGRASLVVYDMDSDLATLVAGEIDLGYQSGDIVMPKLRWGMAGIARLPFSYQHGAQHPVTVLELIQPTTGETLRFDLGLADGENARVDDFMWGEHLGRHVILLRRGASWEALDPLLGARSRLSAPPRLKNRFVAGGIELMPIAVSAEGKWQIQWHALAQGVIYATGFKSARAAGGRQPALSSDGMAAAWHDGAALHVWRGGDEAIGAAEAADMPEFPIPGPVSLAWSPMIWSATGEAATAQAVATAEPQPTHCALPPQLTPGQTAVVSPGLANRVRSGASLNAGVIGRIAPGEAVYVLGGPVCAHGYHWYEIQNEGIRGWTVEGVDANYWLLYFVDCADSPPIRLGVGMSAVVTPGKANNIRSGPGVNGTAILGKVGAGEQLDITGFPICDASGLRWFPMRFGELEGWTAAGQGDEYWIEPAE